MGDLSKNFNRSEFTCACGCRFDVVDSALLKALQWLVDFTTNNVEHTNLVITGGNRCKEHNETIQRMYNPKYFPYSSRSQHMLGKAVDFKLYITRDGEREQMPPTTVFELLNVKYPNTFGIGLYDNRNHLDSRTKRARW